MTKERDGRKSAYWAIHSCEDNSTMVEVLDSGDCEIMGNTWNRAEWNEFKTMVDEIYDAAEFEGSR